MILTEGTLQPYIYIVKSGQLKAVKTEGRRMQNLVVLGPGDFIGEMAHLGSNKLHYASIIALTDVELIQIEAAKIYEVLAANPIWLKAILNNLIKKIEAANTKQDLFKTATDEGFHAEQSLAYLTELENHFGRFSQQAQLHLAIGLRGKVLPQRCCECRAQGL